MEKKFFWLFALFFALTSCSKKIYIVRHAEKNIAIKDNPPLTQNGESRAIKLMQILKNKNIKTIYSTNTLRTTNTAMPLSKKINVAIQFYKPDTAENLLQKIFISKKNTLIVGHSNTILPMLSILKIKYNKTEIPDWEYDNLIIVKYKKYCFDCTYKYKVKKVQFKKYGAISKS